MLPKPRARPTAPNPDDGRSNRIALTKLALARLPQAIATVLPGNRDAMAGFTDAEITQFAACSSD